jgi:hypothetical protein
MCQDEGRERLAIYSIIELLKVTHLWRSGQPNLGILEPG